MSPGWRGGVHQQYRGIGVIPYIGRGPGTEPPVTHPVEVLCEPRAQKPGRTTVGQLSAGGITVRALLTVKASRESAPWNKADKK